MAEARAMTDIMDVPLVYSAGTIVFARQFTTSVAFMSMVPFMDKDRTKAEDIGRYLFFVHCFNSQYKSMPEPDRLKTAMLDKRFQHQDWLISILQKPEMEDLIDYYCMVALTPSQRIYQSLVDALERWQREISLSKGDGDTNPMELVDRGIALHEKFKAIEKIVREEGSRRVRSDYAPRRFERRPEGRAVRAS